MAAPLRVALGRVRAMSTLKVAPPKLHAFLTESGDVLVNRNVRSDELVHTQPKRLGFKTDTNLHKSFYNR